MKHTKYDIYVNAFVVISSGVDSDGEYWFKDIKDEKHYLRNEKSLDLLNIPSVSYFKKVGNNRYVTIPRFVIELAQVLPSNPEEALRYVKKHYKFKVDMNDNAEDIAKASSMLRGVVGFARKYLFNDVRTFNRTHIYVQRVLESEYSKNIRFDTAMMLTLKNKIELAGCYLGT